MSHTDIWERVFRAERVASVQALSMQHAGWVQELGETRSKVGQQQQMRSERLWETGSCGPLAPPPVFGFITETRSYWGI